MDNSIYEVERDDYAGVIGQINPETSNVSTYHGNYGTIIKIISKEGIHFTTRVISDDGEEHYYVFSLPQGEDRLPPKRIRKIVLKTKEEVQHFFNALSELQKRNKEND